MKEAFVLLVAVAVCAPVEAAENAPDIWRRIQIGMKLLEASEILRAGHANITVIRPDKSGYKKFWPNNMNALVVAGESERAFIPYGHVLTLSFNSHETIIDMSREFVSEKEFEKSVMILRNER